MRYISREEQLRATTSFVSLFNLESVALSDSLLDGELIEEKSSAINWIDENEVHKGKILSHNIGSNRSFIGRQKIAVYDEIRKRTHVLQVESDSLFVSTLQQNEIISRNLVRNGFTARAHITLKKYNGSIYVLHCSSTDGEVRLFLNNQQIATTSNNIDFPFMSFSQVPIGHVAITPPEYGLLTYKCRDTGSLFIRTIQDDQVQDERILSAPDCLGGLDFGISGDKVLFKIDAVVANEIVPMVAISNDRGQSISDFSPIDLSELNAERILPSSASVVVDYLGNFHVPLGAFKENKVHVLNIIPEEAIVDAITFESGGYGIESAAFPKNPNRETELGRGDGFTDGLGLIATGLSDGRLIASNSQAGGIFFPKDSQLNYEMPRVFSFKSTECYTRGILPNTVSMDYIFIEADDRGAPISKSLLIETWDMPLPEPKLKARVNGRAIRLEIVQDAWFEVGKTTFEISNPLINIVSASITGGRTAEIECDSDELIGLTVTFEMKNLFYYHRASAQVEQE